MRGVNVTLQEDEKTALVILAQKERRDPRAQAALIIRQALQERGLLAADDARQPMPAAGVNDDHAEVGKCENCPLKK